MRGGRIKRLERNVFLDEQVEDCSDSHHSRAAGVIPATPANESLPSEKDRNSITKVRM